MGHPQGASERRTVSWSLLEAGPLGWAKEGTGQAAGGAAREQRVGREKHRPIGTFRGGSKEHLSLFDFYTFSCTAACGIQIIPQVYGDGCLGIDRKRICLGI